VQVLSSGVDLSAFIARIADAPGRVLMLDYDGTLAPFRIDPAEARPYPEVPPLLEEIVATGATRVVIVSGRPAQELPPLLDLTPRPEIWGSHGWERLLSDGRSQVEAPAAPARQRLSEAAAAVREVMPAGARLEHKLASVALHWRGLREREASALRDVATNLWGRSVSEGELELLPFDGGLELRAVGCNKQYAVKAVLSETEEGAAIAYLGDDITDEDAFRAVKPRGVGVLVRAQFRETNADVWIRPPHELVAFLEHWRVSRR
jgi:trehalose 6-phosphate phosphatase